MVPAFRKKLRAGVEGLEPSTFGFGDQRSTNWTMPLYTFKISHRSWKSFNLLSEVRCPSSIERPETLTSILVTLGFRQVFLGQALDRLVTVSSMRCRTSTSALSTWYSLRGLTSSREGISHLGGGFTLRCLQRLSLPDLATLPWDWFPTGTPVVRPARSSRTKASSPQISSARAG